VSDTGPPSPADAPDDDAEASPRTLRIEREAAIAIAALMALIVVAFVVVAVFVL